VSHFVCHFCSIDRIDSGVVAVLRVRVSLLTMFRILCDSMFVRSLGVARFCIGSISCLDGMEQRGNGSKKWEKKHQENKIMDGNTQHTFHTHDVICGTCIVVYTHVKYL